MQMGRDERSPFGFALPGVSGAAPTTTPERLSESHGLRCLIAANVSGRNQFVAQDGILRVNLRRKIPSCATRAGRCAGPPRRQSNLQKRRSRNSLRASSLQAAPDPESVKPNQANTYKRCASR